LNGKIDALYQYPELTATDDLSKFPTGNYLSKAVRSPISIISPVSNYKRRLEENPNGEKILFRRVKGLIAKFWIIVEIVILFDFI
jgi:hypothetical protein